MGIACGCEREKEREREQKPAGSGAVVDGERVMMARVMREVWCADGGVREQNFSPGTADARWKFRICLWITQEEGGDLIKIGGGEFLNRVNEFVMLSIRFRFEREFIEFYVLFMGGGEKWICFFYYIGGVRRDLINYNN